MEKLAERWIRKAGGLHWLLNSRSGSMACQNEHDASRPGNPSSLGDGIASEVPRCSKTMTARTCWPLDTTCRLSMMPGRRCSPASRVFCVVRLLFHMSSSGTDTWCETSVEGLSFAFPHMESTWEFAELESWIVMKIAWTERTREG